MGAPALQDGPRHVVLGCYSNFSFLRGAAHPHEMVEAAAALAARLETEFDLRRLSGEMTAAQESQDV